MMVCILFGQNGETALMLAADVGHLEVVELLLAHPDVDVNVQDKVNRFRQSVSVLIDISQRFIVT